VSHVATVIGMQPRAALHQIVHPHAFECNKRSMDCTALQIGTPAAPLAYGLMMRRGSIVMQLWPPALPQGGLTVTQICMHVP
jgi:hypothetical protein